MCKESHPLKIRQSRVHPHFLTIAMLCSAVRRVDIYRFDLCTGAPFLRFPPSVQTVPKEIFNAGRGDSMKECLETLLV